MKIEQEAEFEDMRRAAIAARMGHHADEKAWKQFMGERGRAKPVRTDPEAVKKSQATLVRKMGIVPVKKGTNKKARI